MPENPSMWAFSEAMKFMFTEKVAYGFKNGFETLNGLKQEYLKWRMNKMAYHKAFLC